MLVAITNITLFSVLLMVIGGVGPSLSDDNAPCDVLELSTNESLGTEASAQKVNAPEPFPALAFIRADTPPKYLEDLRLPRLARGIILTALGCHAKVEVDREQDVLDGDDIIPRRK